MLLPLLLLAFFLLAAYYSFRVPLWEAPDEPMHVAVLRDMAAGRLPLLMSQRTGIGEEYQPPLYYIMVAPVVGIADGTWLPALPLPFPRGAVAAAYAGRLVSPVLAVATLACVYYLVLALMARRRLAIMVTAFTALTPGFAMTSATANNDNAAILFASAATLCCVRAVCGRGKPVPNLVLGVCAAVAAAMSKLTGLYALVIVGIAVAVFVAQGGSIRHMRKLALGIGAAGTVLVLAWAQTSQFGTGARIKAIMNGSAGLSPQNWSELPGRATVENLSSFASDLVTSYWGTDGWQTYTPLNRVTYWAVGVCLCLAVIGATAQLVRRGSRQRWQRGTSRSIVMLGLALVVLIGALLAAAIGEGYTLTGRSHARYVFPAIGTVSLLIVAGCSALFPAGWRTGASALLIIGLLPLHVFATFSGPLVYSGPVSGEGSQAALIERGQAPVQFTSGVRLVAFASDPAVVRAGDAVDFTLLWQADQPQDKDFVAFLHLVDARGEAITKNDEIPTIHRFPPRLWRSGDLVVEHRALRIPDSAPVGSYKVQFGAYLPSRPMTPVSITRPDGVQNVPRIDLCQLVIHPKPTVVPAAARRIGAEFADGIVLDSVLGGTRTGRQDEIAVSLYWSAANTPRSDYSVSLQMLGPGGTLIAQQDGPLGDSFRASQWHPNEMVSEEHLLSIPKNLPPAAYALAVAVYDAGSGERLAVSGPTVDASRKMVRIGEVRID